MKLNVLIGLPGCGKSTWAAQQQNYITISSDRIRKELYGSEEIQDNPKKIFEIAFERVRKNLKNNKNVIFDATNLNRKDRRGIIEIGRQCGAEIYGIVFRTSFEKCLENNQKRERKVPEFVYEKMLKKFEFPMVSEGFFDIFYVGNGEENCENFWEKMLYFDQKNHHHSLTLGEHCKIAAEKANLDVKIPYIKANSENETHPPIIESKTDPTPLYLAAKWHDIGKLFTKSEEDEFGDCHYYGHANYGAYLFMTSKQFDPLVCKLINYHMVPYGNQINNFKKRHEKEPDNFFDLLIKLHKLDVEAH